MHPTQRMLRASAARLAEAVKMAREEAKTAGWLCENTIDTLRTLTARCEQDLLRAGDYSDRPPETHAAMRLLRRYDLSYDARRAHVAEIDRLTLICDQIMDCGLLPAPVYLCGLAKAVLEYELHQSCGDDEHITSTAWDVLAQAEAGLGKSVEPEHYQQALNRHAHVCCASDNVELFSRGRHQTGRDGVIASALAAD